MYKRQISGAIRAVLFISIWGFVSVSSIPAYAADTVARQWNEELLEAIRNDFARPTVHARNLFHLSIAMWDAWAAYDDLAKSFLHIETATAADNNVARNEAISFAAYRLLRHRFGNSPGAVETLPAIYARMTKLGFDTAFESKIGDSPAALGNRIAATVIEFGANDGANENDDYAFVHYRSANHFHPLIPFLTGNSGLYKPNRWQPLALRLFIDQAGHELAGRPTFVSPHWGDVTPFALKKEMMKKFKRGRHEFKVYNDPGPPPYLRGIGDAEYHAGFMQVVEWSSKLDPADGVMMDISPNARGDSKLGTNNGTGRPLNPVTGQPYKPQIVPAGDYYRVLAEFWADGPDSETPPGHWFTIANYVSDHRDVVKRIAGKGPVVDALEWDVKLYIALGGAMHDAAVSAWSIKGWYDYVRPISAIRYMSGLGQRTDRADPSYHPDGVDLVPGKIEIITEDSIAPGQKFQHLAGPGNSNIGKIAAYTWRGPDYIENPETSTAGVGWILLNDWWPYQRPTFVTPPFSGYVSGHSTYSRAAAELLTAFTGNEYFPGGLGEFVAPKNEFLVFEDGPSVDITLQWATYRDASDETSISRIYGGIHPRADDIPGRIIGARVGVDAYEKACSLFKGC